MGINPEIVTLTKSDVFPPAGGEGSPEILVHPAIPIALQEHDPARVLSGIGRADLRRPVSRTIFSDH
jgi:hypothetical protein